MLYEGKIWIGTGEKPVFLLPRMANRHGLIAGATGTGKTVSLKVVAEAFSDMGVPVFLSDIKGDLSGMVKAGEDSESMHKRLAKCGVSSFEFHAFPTSFWDVYEEQGIPVRATVQEMGPLLLSRMLDLNDIQSGVLNILFRIANDENLPLVGISDLQSALAYIGSHAKNYTVRYGNISIASVGAIQRAVAMLEDQGGNVFFGEPALNILDWERTDENGRGYINILSCDRLFNNPTMYSTFLLWMLSRLYEKLPERGDADKPRMVFFFDEAHLLFNNCSKTLMDKIEQIVRLIRSKGVGVYFITQSPSDIPMTILGQLGNRIQHALRAYTPLDQKAVNVAAQTFRANPKFNTEEAITQLKTGEALISFLDEDGAPSIVERVTILPPQSYMGAIDSETRAACIAGDAMFSRYQMAVSTEKATVTGGFAYAGISPDQVQTYTAPAQTVPYGIPMMVFNPATGQYVPMQQTVQYAQQPMQYVQQPVVQQPVQYVQQPVTAQPVQYVQQPAAEPPVQYVQYTDDEQTESFEQAAPAAPQSIPNPFEQETPAACEVPVLDAPSVSSNHSYGYQPSSPVPTLNIPDEVAEDVPASALPNLFEQEDIKMSTPKFNVYNPATGEYEQKEVPEMAIPTAQQPVVQQPVQYVQQPVQYAQQPVVQQPVQYAQQPVQYTQQPVVQQPVQYAQQVVQQPVMVYNPTTGQYTQQMMNMQFDPTTGQYVPVQAQVLSAEEQEKLRKQQEKAEKEAAKAAKEADAAARRQRTDELREERAERARRNDSIAGRVKNTAVSTATRQVTSTITKTITKGLTDLLSGKKK